MRVYLFLCSAMAVVACGDKALNESPSDTQDTGAMDSEASEEVEDDEEPPVDDPEPEDTGDTPPDPDDSEPDDTGSPPDIEDEVFVPDWPDGTDPFADRIVSFDPGPDAGFGSDDAPDIVLGWPEGRGSGSGSLDVMSLGESGSIVLAMDDLHIVDGPGPDLLVFENPFSSWFEAGAVAVSNDGETWVEWPCDGEDVEGEFPGCAGVGYVFANSSEPIDPTDPEVAGGDAFDLADVGLTEAKYVRIRDTGFNTEGYGGSTGGFDLDAVAAVNWIQTEATE